MYHLFNWWEMTCHSKASYLVHNSSVLLILLPVQLSLFHTVNRVDTPHYNAVESFISHILAQKQESTLILHSEWESERKSAGEQNVDNHTSVSADGS